MSDDARIWMWSEALQMLARAERLHREVFHRPPRGGVSWEPPTDVLETAQAVLVFVALPGVDPAQLELSIADGVLSMAGERVLPEELRTAIIHRLELPQGRFERRVPLPPGHYDKPRSVFANGCLVIRLRKLRGARARP